MSSLFRTTLVVFLAMLTCSCVSSYHSHATSAYAAFHRGNYAKAADLIADVSPARKDRLLYLLDRGMILHAAGRYEESNKVLAEAEDLADLYTTKSVSREVGATLWSEEGTEYAGDKYERVLIPVVRMLNYAMLDQWREAVVEVRRLQTLVEKNYGSNHQYDNAFGLYLSAIVWEAIGQINDAFIDYQRMATVRARAPYYAQDMKALNAHLGLSARYPPKGSLPWKTSKGYRRDEGQLVVIVEAGRSPYFVSEFVTNGVYTMAMPVAIVRSPLIEQAEVKVDGTVRGTTYPFYTVAKDIQKALYARQRRTLIRKAIKTPVQTGLYVAGYELSRQEEIESKLAGVGLILLGASMSVAEKADERSWRTLPAQFQIGRFYLKPGTHTIEVGPKRGGNAIVRTVEVVAGRPSMMLVRFPHSAGRARRVRNEGSEHLAKAKKRERELAREVRRDRDRGALKVELAEARIAAGDYDVEILLEEAIEQGGSKRKAARLLVTAGMVKGDYAEARRWAKVCGGECAFASDVASFLAGDGSRPSTARVKKALRSGSMKAVNFYVMGLINERERLFDDATEFFAASYRNELVGKPVIAKIAANYRRSSKRFQRSTRGVASIGVLANSFERK